MATSSSQAHDSPRQSAALRLGRGLRRFLGQTGSMAWLAFQCLRQALHLRPAQLGLLAEMVRKQVRFTALDAVPLVTLTALLLGGATLLEVMAQLEGLVSASHLSRAVALLVVRELGPVLVAVLIVVRSGTAIAAELASLKLGKEVDALYATGVDPIAYLLLPRIFGCIVSLFSLLVLFDVMALIGGFLVVSAQIPLSFELYFRALQRAIGLPELAGTLVKAAVFGSLIPLVCADSGLRLRVSSTEIPQAVTRAAVESVVAIFVLNALISLVCYG